MIREIVNHDKIKFLFNLWIVVLTIFFSTKMVIASNSWQVVGKTDFSAGWAEYISMANDRNDVPYVSFRDGANGNKLTVMSFDGRSWVTVGSPAFSPDKVNDTTIVFDYNNVPYVMFREQGTDKLMVMSYSGSAWQSLGVIGTSSSASWTPSLAFNSSNVPYAVFKDDSNGNKVTVVRFDASKNKWVSVGSAGFSSNWVSYTSMIIDKSNNIYVGFSDANNNWGPNVMKFDGTKWSKAGFGLSNIQTNTNVMAFDTKGIPYMAYRDGATGNAITVVKYDGSSWNTVGSAGIGSPMGCCGYDDVGFVIGSNNVPYVAFVDSYNSNKVTVLGYTGSSWSVIGTAGFTRPVERVSLSVDSNNTLYISVEDTSNHKATVMKFDQGQSKKLWKPAGNTGSYSNNSEIVSIVSDFNNTKYVAFSDSDQNDKATVIKYDGLNSWSRVGNAGFTKDRADWTSIAISQSGAPYVAFSDASQPDMGNVGKASVMRYLGGIAGWVNIGKPGFSQHGAEYTRLAIDRNDTPYVVFVDNNPKLNNPLTVMKYDGKNWVPVGVPGFTNGTAWYPNIVFDNLNIPYVSYRDQSTGKAVVMKFDGRRWVNVGPAGFTMGSVDYPQIKFDTNNNLYIAFQDWSQDGKTTVMKYDGVAAWNVVGSAGFSKEESYGTSLYIYNNVPYVSFSYVSDYSGKNENGVTVMAYDSLKNSWDEVGQNPIASPASYTNMIIDKIGIPYVVAPGDNVTVMKFE